MKYRVVTSVSRQVNGKAGDVQQEEAISALVSEVEGMIAEGWEPIGGVAISGVGETPFVRYLQAMINKSE
jgi:hypothetical protein